MTEHVESEKKRLLSLKRKKEAFKVKEQFIRDALKNVDNQKVNKIVFDDNIEETIVNKKQKKNSKALFDDEDDTEEVTWSDKDFDTKKNVDPKYMKLQASFGNDSRFTLDDRFLEKDEEEKESGKEDSDYDLQKEKEWQYNILEDVLGAPVGTNKPKDQEPLKKYAMIRYDPTEDKHKEYELTTAQIESNTKTKKKKKKKETETLKESNENDPVIVSKDVYYSVSDTLTKSLKPQGEFSLLKKFGKEIDNTEKVENAAVNEEIKDVPKKQKTFLNFDSTNPFKYDSSDNENEDEPDVQQSLDHKQEEQKNNLFHKYSDNLFFSENDPRFNDALNFFKKESVPNNEFKSLRRELKQIVRIKVRKNVRKAEVWGSKRKIRKPS